MDVELKGSRCGWSRVKKEESAGSKDGRGGRSHMVQKFMGMFSVFVPMLFHASRATSSRKPSLPVPTQRSCLSEPLG